MEKRMSLSDQTWAFKRIEELESVLRLLASHTNFPKGSVPDAMAAIAKAALSGGQDKPLHIDFVLASDYGKLASAMLSLFDNHESWDSDTWDSIERIWRERL